MKKDLGVIFGLFLIVIILVIFGGGFTSTSFLIPPRESTPQAKKNNFVEVSVRELKIDAELANTPDLRRKGLSGKESLEINKGMLFIFDKSLIYAFWMKGMKFPIDIIWIGENKKIVHIEENAYPEPGKKDNELKRYASLKEAKYILEINAGLAKHYGLQSGDDVVFPL